MGDFSTDAVEDRESTLFSLSLTDDTAGASSAVALKSSFEIHGTNLGGGEQSTHLIDKDIGGDALLVQSELATAAHGTLTPSGAPATLAVFQFAFAPRAAGTRFKEVSVTLTFSAGEVQRVAPTGMCAVQRSEKQRETSHALSPNIAATFGPASMSAGYTWTLMESETIEASGRLGGYVRHLGQHRSAKRANTALWEMHENGDRKSGIPTFVQTAVLLKREGVGEKFNAEIAITGKVSGLAVVKDTVMDVPKRLFTKKKKGEAVFFNFKISTGEIEDASNLSGQDLNKYQQLVTMAEWADGGKDSEEQEQPLSPPLSPPSVLSPISPPIHTVGSVVQPLVSPPTQATDSVPSPERLLMLRTQLSRVRYKKKLVNRMLELMEEEDKLCVEIEHLESS